MDYLVIKNNNTFLLTDLVGNITPDHKYGLGLYKQDTRFLNTLKLSINGEEPVFLAADGKNSNVSLSRLTNASNERDGELLLWQESVEIKRYHFIYNDSLYETLELTNYSPKEVAFSLRVAYQADFSDMFIVRGFQTGKIGKVVRRSCHEKGAVIHYEGSDHLERRLKLEHSPSADRFDDGWAEFDVVLPSHEKTKIHLAFAPEIGDETVEIVTASIAHETIEKEYHDWKNASPSITSDYKLFDELIIRGMEDLHILQTDIGYGPFPVAGLPWFAVPFGRDSLIAALQILPFNPETAKGTLRTMSALQGKEKNKWRDEAPGKIMHEIRFGELANTNQIPFTPYYGSVDATPLFLVLITEYVKWTGDMALFHELKDSIMGALEWIGRYGDPDHDGFVEYFQESEKGIANQGWKDSGDSIVHRDSQFAEPPIALVEVQGYVHQAKIGLSELFYSAGDTDMGLRLKNEAEALKTNLNNKFWMEEHQYYALALDKEKNQVATITSNPGHLLMSKALDQSRADAVIDKLISGKMFSGYGIRTMAEGEAAYNPMSYHNGSIWPHDNSLILLGMANYERADAAKYIMEGILKASNQFEFNRLPELFCGYSDQIGEVIRYPVACSPQAWAAGTPLILLRVMLGLSVDMEDHLIRLSPFLLENMNELKVEKMPAGKGFLSMTLTREDQRVRTEITENSSGMRVEIQ